MAFEEIEDKLNIDQLLPDNEASNILGHYHAAVLETMICPIDVSQLLYSERCIDEQTLDELEGIEVSLYNKKMVLLTAIYTAVSLDYKKLKVFGTILSKFEEMSSLGNEILTAYNQKFPNEEKTVFQTHPSDSASNILRNHYGNLSLCLHHLIGVAHGLWEDKVISDSTLSVINGTGRSQSEIKGVLFKAIRGAVHSNHHNLQVFGNVLNTTPENIPFGYTILKDYARVIGGHEAQTCKEKAFAQKDEIRQTSNQIDQQIQEFESIFRDKKVRHCVASQFLSYLDAESLSKAEQVCSEWYRIISEEELWKKLIIWNVKTIPVWKELSERRQWGQYLNNETTPPTDSNYFKKIYPSILKDIQTLEDNWNNGVYTFKSIRCTNGELRGVYCLQYDDERIVCGLRDCTIKMWHRDTMECSKVFSGHTGSVLCLQYNENIIISGSVDSTIRVWDIVTGQIINTLIHHSDAILHLQFNKDMLVTSSKDRTIAVWDINTPSDITIKKAIVGHTGSVNVVEFDEKYIISGAGDRTIKIWCTKTCEFVRTLEGHGRGIASLHYKGNFVVSGSDDIRIWDIEYGLCVRVLQGHQGLVRCIRFDDMRIVSGSYDGTVKIWDMKAALDPTTPANNLCLQTLSDNTSWIFRLQFDNFKVVCGSEDDVILIWDFFPVPPVVNETETTDELVSEEAN